MRWDFHFQWDVSESERPVYGKPPEPTVAFTIPRGGEREGPVGPILGGRTREGRTELGLKEREESAGDQRGENTAESYRPRRCQGEAG